VRCLGYLFKYILITVLVSFLLSISGCVNDDEDGTGGAAEQCSLLPPGRQQEAVLEFIDALTAKDEEPHKVFTQYLEVLDYYTQARVGFLTMYENSQRMKEWYSYARSAVYSIPTPERVSDETKTLLERAQSNRATAWRSRELGIKDITKYLDTKRISNLANAKQRFEDANAFTHVAAVYVVAAKESVGIEIAEQVRH